MKKKATGEGVYNQSETRVDLRTFQHSNSCFGGLRLVSTLRSKTRLWGYWSGLFSVALLGECESNKFIHAVTRKRESRCLE